MAVTKSAKELAAYDITHAVTGDQVRRVVKEHSMVGYKNLLASLPAPARKPTPVAGPLTVEIVTECHVALRKAKTPAAISRIRESHRDVFNGSTDRIIGMMLNYQTLNAQRIVAKAMEG